MLKKLTFRPKTKFIGLIRPKVTFLSIFRIVSVLIKQYGPMAEVSFPAFLSPANAKRRETFLAKFCMFEVLIYDNVICRPADRFHWINIFSHDVILLFALHHHLCCMSLPLCGVVIFLIKRSCLAVWIALFLKRLIGPRT